MIKSESIAELSKALAKFHEEVKQPMKDKDNPFFKSKYVPLENVVEAVDGTAPKHGLSYVQWPCNNDDGRIGIVTMITHASGEFMEFDPVYMKSEKDTPQGNGSTLTYLRRYSLSAVFGITSDQDDDGNAGSGNVNGKKGNQQSKPIKQRDIGVIKTKVMRFADMREKKPVDVYKALSIKEQDLPDFTEEQSVELIEKLDSWIKKADKEMANK